MAERQRVPGSLRYVGLTTVTVDNSTKAKLKELAGETPISHYIRELAFGRVKPPSASSQAPIPGQERQVSSNTLAAVNSRLDDMTKLQLQCQLMEHAILKHLGLGLPDESLEVIKRKLESGQHQPDPQFVDAVSELASAAINKAKQSPQLGLDENLNEGEAVA